MWLRNGLKPFIEPRDSFQVWGSFRSTFCSTHTGSLQTFLIQQIVTCVTYYSLQSGYASARDLELPQVARTPFSLQQDGGPVKGA